MSTRSMIGVYTPNEDGEVWLTYCHFDGYPSGVGEALMVEINRMGTGALAKRIRQEPSGFRVICERRLELPGVWCETEYVDGESVQTYSIADSALAQEWQEACPDDEDFDAWFNKVAQDAPETFRARGEEVDMSTRSLHLTMKNSSIEYIYVLDLEREWLDVFGGYRPMRLIGRIGFDHIRQHDIVQMTAQLEAVEKNGDEVLLLGDVLPESEQQDGLLPLAQDSDYHIVIDEVSIGDAFRLDGERYILLDRVVTEDDLGDRVRIFLTSESEGTYAFTATYRRYPEVSENPLLRPKDILITTIEVDRVMFLIGDKSRDRKGRPVALLDLFNGLHNLDEPERREYPQMWRDTELGRVLVEVYPERIRISVDELVTINRVDYVIDEAYMRCADGHWYLSSGMGMSRGKLVDGELQKVYIDAAPVTEAAEAHVEDVMTKALARTYVHEMMTDAADTRLHNDIVSTRWKAQDLSEQLEYRKLAMDFIWEYYTRHKTLPPTWNEKYLMTSSHAWKFR